jgi:23S rRNA (cytidine1920-2'-O)/16S rRNA (cytidine1409-2'-O)-methyltransferase
MLLEANRVTVGGAISNNPNRQVSRAEAVEVLPAPAPFVSRAGHKLSSALDHFGIEVNHRRCLDAGASTGGFTDVLLQRGAAVVTCVDVGYGILHERIRDDARVVNLERTNVRDITVQALGGPVDLVVADLSFISLTTVIETLLRVTAPDGELVLMAKPQFEVSKETADRFGGVITEPDVWLTTLRTLVAGLAARGFAAHDASLSPLPGPKGNREFFLHGRYRLPQAPPQVVSDDRLEAVVAEAAGGAHP